MRPPAIFTSCHFSSRNAMAVVHIKRLAEHQEDCQKWTNTNAWFEWIRSYMKEPYTTCGKKRWHWLKQQNQWHKSATKHGNQQFIICKIGLSPRQKGSKLNQSKTIPSKIIKFWLSTASRGLSLFLGRNLWEVCSKKPAIISAAFQLMLIGFVHLYKNESRSPSISNQLQSNIIYPNSHGDGFMMFYDSAGTSSW